MYPVRLGFDVALKRIHALSKNGHHAEALITSVFTFEKTLRRSLLICGLSRGFSSKHCELLFDRMSFQSMKQVWPCFEKSHKTLPEFIGQAWQHVPKGVTMRNKLAHGEAVYDLAECREYSDYVVTAADTFRDLVIQHYGLDCWSKLPSRRRSSLIWAPPNTSGTNSDSSSKSNNV